MSHEKWNCSGHGSYAGFVIMGASPTNKRIVQFDGPELLDAGGKALPFELEGGGYDDDRFSTEIRVISKDRVDLVEFVKIKGTGKIKYPLKDWRVLECIKKTQSFIS